jgi:zinc and cadmium transporter
VSAVLVAALAGLGFAAASLLGLAGREMGAGGRAYATAVAAGILLALAFGDLFPEALELAGGAAVAGFVGGFALLFLVEAFTQAHTHHSPEEDVRKHALGPFVLGLGVHNFADGFVLGVTAKASTAAAGIVGLGVLVHQIPVGVSLAAVFAAARAARGRVLRAAVLLGLVIPLAAASTVALPAAGDGFLGALTGIAGGVLAYVGASHLLPEAQAERPSRAVGVVFVATLAVTTVAILTVLGD